MMGAPDEAALARLRANADFAGIALRDEDVARISSGAYFHNVEALRQLMVTIPPDTLPDHLREAFHGPRDQQSGAA